METTRLGEGGRTKAITLYCHSYIPIDLGYRRETHGFDPPPPVIIPK